jgi:hypothetical protein
VGVEHVDVRRAREARVQRQSQETTVPEVVHLRPEGGTDLRPVRRRVIPRKLRTFGLEFATFLAYRKWDGRPYVG